MPVKLRFIPATLFGLLAVFATVVTVILIAFGPAAAQGVQEPLGSGLASYPPYETPTATPTPTPEPTPPCAESGMAPVVTAIDPSHGADDLFTWVTIQGGNFQNAPSVFIGNTPLSDVSRVNGNLILAGVPPRMPPGAHDVRVRNPDGACGVLPNGYTVTGTDPILSAIVPDQGYNDTPNDVTLFGFNLHAGMLVTIGDQMLEEMTWLNATQVQGVVPVGIAAGVYDVVARNPGNPNSSVLEDAYTVVDPIGDDFSAGEEDLWTSPTTIRQGDIVQLGLSVHRQGGKSTQMVEVAFYLVGAGRTYQEIGRAMTPPMPPGSHTVDAAFFWWDTSNLPDTVHIKAIIDPDHELQETTTGNNIVERFFTLLPSGGDEEPPVINDLKVNGGAETAADPNIVVTIDASDTGGSGVVSMYLVEREFNSSARQWVAIQSTGWIDFQSPFNWRLTERGGVRYIQGWVADGAGNISEVTVKARIDYSPALDRVQAGQVRVYRRTLLSGEVVTARLEVMSGDADLYVWRPDGNQSWVSNHLDVETDQVTFTAPMAGDYQFEVYGFQTSDYRLLIETTAARSQTPAEVTYVAAEKPVRTQPVVDPQNQPEGRAAIPLAPITISPSSIYLPAVQR